MPALDEEDEQMLNDNLARQFLWAGRVGFWTQVGIGSISLVMAISAFLLDRRTGVGTRGAVALIQYLTLASLLLLAFTAIWSYRYMLIGKRIADFGIPEVASLSRTVWIGLVASTVGIVFSMLIMLFEAVQLFLYFLRAPQAGVPVVQTTSGPTSWVSAGDVLSLTVIILTTFVEVLVLALGLWLLFSTLSRRTR
jgi:hypothetical protein